MFIEKKMKLNSDRSWCYSRNHINKISRD